MAGMFHRTIALAGAIFFASPISADCPDCMNDTLSVTSAATALGDGQLNQVMQAALTGDSSSYINVIRSQEHLDALCEVWNEGQNWNQFKALMDSYGYKLKDIIFELRCHVGTTSNIPIFHTAALQPTLYRVIYRRAMRQLHHEDADHLVTCAALYQRYINVNLFEEFSAQKRAIERYINSQTDPTLIETGRQALEDLERMEAVFNDHIQRFPIENQSQCVISV